MFFRKLAGSELVGTERPKKGPFENLLKLILTRS